MINSSKSFSYNDSNRRIEIIKKIYNNNKIIRKISKNDIKEKKVKIKKKHISNYEKMRMRIKKYSESEILFDSGYINFENICRCKLNSFHYDECADKRKLLNNKHYICDCRCSCKYKSSLELINKRVKRSNSYSIYDIDDDNNEFSIYNNKPISFLTYSDNEDNIKESELTLKDRLNLKTNVDLYTYFNQESVNLTKRILKIEKKQEIKRKYNKEKDIISLIDEYNNERFKYMNKDKVLYKKKSNTKQEKDSSINKLIEYFSSKLSLFKEIFNEKKLKNLKKINKSVEYKDIFINNKHDSINYTDYLIKNINSVQNIYFQLSYGVEMFYPDLFSINPLRYIIKDKYNLLDKQLLYNLFTQFKVLIKMCIALNKNLNSIKEGISFKAFHRLIPEIWNENKSFANSLFKIFNKSKSNFISIDEYITGFSQLRSTNIENKLDIFMKIIDNDGNGRLSYKEVYELSMNSLNKVFGYDNEAIEIKQGLASLFSDMIFKICETDFEDEIFLPKIKEKIIIGGEEVEYLEMFCCSGL